MANDKQVLIIRLSAMGDVIFTIPLANVLKSNGYKVTWLTSEKGYSLLENNPCVDEVILVPAKKWKKQIFLKNFIEYLQILKYIRSKHFDISIDTQLLFKTFIWQKFCGAKRRIVSKSAREFAQFGGNEVIGKLYTSYKTHVTQDYLKFAEYLGLDTHDITVTLPPAKSETVAKIEKILQKTDRTKPIITISPATTWATKHWNKDNWKNLINNLKNDYNLIFTGTNADNSLIEYISGGDGLNICGQTDISELCELFRHSDLVISLDSGSTHLAWAAQVPKIVSIFCSTPKTRYAPIGNADKYIALSGNLPCQPCHKKKCPHNNNECTKYPSVDEVLCAVNKLTGKI